MLWLCVPCWLQDVRVPSEMQLWAWRGFGWGTVWPWRGPSRYCCKALIASDNKHRTYVFFTLSFITKEWMRSGVKDMQEDTEILQVAPAAPRNYDFSLFALSQTAPSNYNSSNFLEMVCWNLEIFQRTHFWDAVSGLAGILRLHVCDSECMKIFGAENKCLHGVQMKT